MNLLEFPTCFDKNALSLLSWQWRTVTINVCDIRVTGFSLLQQECDGADFCSGVSPWKGEASLTWIPVCAHYQSSEGPTPALSPSHLRSPYTLAGSPSGHPLTGSPCCRCYGQRWRHQQLRLVTPERSPGRSPPAWTRSFQWVWSRASQVSLHSHQL